MSRTCSLSCLADRCLWRRSLTANGRHVSCLLNPDFVYLDQNDGITATRVSLGGTQLAAKVCSGMVAHLQPGELDCLLDLADIATSYANASFNVPWGQVQRQWKQIHDWLSWHRLSGLVWALVG